MREAPGMVRSRQVRAAALIVAHPEGTNRHLHYMPLHEMVNAICIK